jgi:hypothetical protein
MYKWLQESMTYALESSSGVLLKMKECDLQKAWSFLEKARKYVKQPSPIICLCEQFVVMCMTRKIGNCYVAIPVTGIIDDYLSIFG